MSGTLYQQITQRSSSGEAGSISIQSVDYSGGILTTTLRINPNDFLPSIDEENKAPSYNVKFIDRTRGVELGQELNLHLDLDGGLYESFEREISVPVPDDTEVEIVFENEIGVAIVPPGGGVPDTSLSTRTVSAIVAVGNPGDPEIVAQVTDQESGVTLRILRAARDGDAGLVEAEIEATGGLQRSAQGFVRVVAGDATDDIQVRSQLSEIAPGGSVRRELTFDRDERESVVVSLVHPAIEGDIVIDGVPLLPGDISAPVSQLRVESVSASQIGNDRAVSVQYQVENATVANGGEDQSGVVQIFFLTDPDLAPDPGQEAQVLAEVPVNVSAGGGVSETVEVRDDLLPAGEYRICARMG
jgi:hypothetical protein